MKKVFGVTVATLAVIGLLIIILKDLLKWSWWWGIGYNLYSYHPYIPYLAWGAWAVFMLMNYARKVHWYYWVLGVVWLITNIQLTYGILRTFYGL